MSAGRGSDATARTGATHERHLSLSGLLIPSRKRRRSSRTRRRQRLPATRACLSEPEGGFTPAPEEHPRDTTAGRRAVGPLTPESRSHGYPAPPRPSAYRDPTQISQRRADFRPRPAPARSWRDSCPAFDFYFLPAAAPAQRACPQRRRRCHSGSIASLGRNTRAILTISGADNWCRYTPAAINKRHKMISHFAGNSGSTTSENGLKLASETRPSDAAQACL